MCCGVSSSRTNKKLVGRNSHQKKLCFTSIFFADDDLTCVVLHFSPMEREQGRCGSFHKSERVQSPPPPQSRAYSRWRGIRMNWFPSQRNVTCDENLWRGNKNIMVSMRHSYEGGWRADRAPSPGIRVAALLTQRHYPSSLGKTLTHSSPQGCARKKEETKNQGSRKRKRILSSSSVVAKGTRSASLCCDWIIILLLIRAVCVFFSVDSSQRGRELCAIQQDQINPMKASQRSPRERAGGRASRQIQGDATATGCAGQSHMAPGQTGGKAITYSLMSHPPHSRLPFPWNHSSRKRRRRKKKGIRSESEGASVMDGN